MMRTLICLVLLGACARASTSTGTANAAIPTPCTVDAESIGTDWKQVTQPEFTFCVPMSWQPSGGRNWRAATTDGYPRVSWQVNPPLPPQRVPFSVGPRTGPVTSAPRPDLGDVSAEIIGGQQVEVVEDVVRGRPRVRATWSRSELHFEGMSNPRDGTDILMLVFRTVRVTPK